MVSKRKSLAVYLCVAILYEVTICDITDNTTHKSVAASEKGKSHLSKFGSNSTTPLLSTRSNFVSASTVLNPPRTATEPVDWALKNFRRWIKYQYSRRLDDPPNIPDDLLNKREVRNEHENFYTEDPQYVELDAGASRVYQNEVSNYYIFKNLERKQQPGLGTENPYYSGTERTTPGAEQIQAENVNLNNSEVDQNKLSETSTDEIKNGNKMKYNLSGLQMPPLAEALHSPMKGNDRINVYQNVTRKNNKEEIAKVSQEPIDKDSMLENLTDMQFSWVDIIIAVCCTAAILLILINIGR